MSHDGRTSAHDFLRDAARACFADRYGKPIFHVDKQLNSQLQWLPSLRFTLHGHIHVLVEPSDNGPYPRRLAMLYTLVNNFPEPIAVYSVCHEAAMETADGRRKRKELRSLGLGLVTVDNDGSASVDFTAIPVVQAIAEADFKQRSKKLPRAIHQPVSEAFEDYLSKPVNGVKTLSEIVEGMIRKAGKDSASKRGGISNAQSKMTPANILDALYEKHSQARAAIGGARSFVNECRNLSHHWPRNKKEAYKKYAYCRDHFLNGLHTIQAFRGAMKKVGLTGNLART